MIAGPSAVVILTPSATYIYWPAGGYNIALNSGAAVAICWPVLLPTATWNSCQYVLTVAATLPWPNTTSAPVMPAPPLLRVVDVVPSSYSLLNTVSPLKYQILISLSAMAMMTSVISEIAIAVPTFAAACTSYNCICVADILSLT